MSTPDHHDPRTDSANGPSSDGPPVAGRGVPPAPAASSSTPTDPPTSPPVAPPATPPREDPTAEDTSRRDRDGRARSADAFPVPTGPRTTSFGGHLLGILVGLVLTLLAGILSTLGQSRILADGVGRSDVQADALGIVLITLGALTVGLVVLLGLWTPAAPFTGGLVAVAVGGAYLFAPFEAHRETVRLVATEQNRTAVLNSITVGTTGGVFLTGIVLLAAATAFSLVRRRGLELGAFRERSQGTPAAH